MTKVKKIGVMSFAKVYMILMAIFGLLEGLIFAVVGSMMAAVAPEEGMGMFAGLGWLGVIIFPIMFAIMGFVLGALSAWLYNVVAGWVGGIELELEN